MLITQVQCGITEAACLKKWKEAVKTFQTDEHTYDIDSCAFKYIIWKGIDTDRIAKDLYNASEDVSTSLH